MSSDTIVIGIDPGVNGAIAALRGLEVVMLEDLPKRAGKGLHPTRDMCDLLSPLTELDEMIIAYIEQPQTRPPESRITALTAGTHFGIWLGILSQAKVPYEIISANSWKSKAGLAMRGATKKEKKDVSMQKAKSLFPNAKVSRHDRAEALLIAYFCPKT